MVSDAGEVVHSVDVELPGPRLPHDMAFTENYVILNDFPLFWDTALLEHNIHLPRFHRDVPSRFAVIPRRGELSQIMWFEADPTYVLHFPNAYEDGDEIDGLGDQRARNGDDGFLDELLEATQRADAGASVDGAYAAGVAGAPGFEQVERF